MAVSAKTGAKSAKTASASKGKPAQVAAKVATSSSGRKATGGAIEARQAKSDKPKKPKMVRDSFTMPENEYAQIAELKKKCLQAGVHVKKSELLRAGLALLSRLQDAALLKTVDQVEHIKTGRPAKS